jgi:Tfp pilus assembly protein FimV
MTTTFSLMLAALVLPGFDSKPRPAVTTPAAVRDTDAQFDSLREAREAVTRVLRASNRASGSNLREAAPSVVSTYRQLARSEKIPVAERRLLLGRLRTRLSEQEAALRQKERQAGPSHAGGVANDAEMLLDLIQSTVSPETWAINGGLGTIYYFPNR